jgi:hypothetical protein
LKSIQKKYDKAKKYGRELEDKLIKKEQKIKDMKLQKKNDDLCSQMESIVEGGLSNELGELEGFQASTPSKPKNLLNNADDDLEPEREEQQEE